MGGVKFPGKKRYLTLEWPKKQQNMTDDTCIENVLAVAYLLTTFIENAVVERMNWVFHDPGMPSGTGTVREYAITAMTTHATASTVQPLPIADPIAQNWKSSIHGS